MNLAKLCLARSSSKSLAIKNFKLFSSSPQAEDPNRAKKTSLFDFHVAREGKIVDFAGYLLPVQYADQGIVQSHIHTRTPGCASIFDVRENVFRIFPAFNSIAVLGVAHAANLHNRKRRNRMF